MAENVLEFGNPQEQLQLAALISRFCGRKAEEFDPNVHVDEAREIVKVLDPKIKLLSSRYWAENIGASSSKSTSPAIVGATDLGEVKVSMGLGRSREIKANVSLEKKEIYGIGAYMVTKFRTPDGFFVLNFKHFLKHGIVNRVIGTFPPYWQIFYDGKSLEPTTISETQSNVRERKIKLPFLEQKTFRYISETPKVVYTTLGKK